MLARYCDLVKLIFGIRVRTGQMMPSQILCGFVPSGRPVGGYSSLPGRHAVPKAMSHNGRSEAKFEVFRPRRMVDAVILWAVDPHDEAAEREADVEMGAAIRQEVDEYPSQDY